MILGAGFGGITALLKLRRRLKSAGLIKNFNLVLVNKTSQHLYTPALYEIASLAQGQAGALCLKTTICIQIEDILKPFPEIRFIDEEAVGMEPEKRVIFLKSGGGINFEYVIIAIGAETNFFGIPGMKEHSCPLKTFEDAVRIRNRVEEIVGSNPGSINTIIVGAGATGVELAAELVNFINQLKSGRVDSSGDEIVLVEAASDILPGFSRAVRRKARRRLDKLGVKIIAGAAIERVEAKTVVLPGGRVIPYHLLIWAGGIRPAAALKNFGLAIDNKGGIAVNEYLKAAKRIYAIGDCAGFVDPKTGRNLPWNVPAAEAQARAAAKNILAEITGSEPQPFRPRKTYPIILAVGGKYALTNLAIIKFSGLLGWLLKQLVELRYLLFILPWTKALRMALRTTYYQTKND